MTPLQASILSNCRIESNRIDFFHPNRNALVDSVLFEESCGLTQPSLWVKYAQLLTYRAKFDSSLSNGVRASRKRRNLPTPHPRMGLRSTLKTYLGCSLVKFGHF